MGNRIQLGFTPTQTTSVVGSALLTASMFTPEPISKAILAAAGGLVQLFSKLFNFGYDADKLNDTAITEGVKIALNGMWYNLTGEDLGGVLQTCTPGQCGAQHVNIFSIPTQYPNVPAGPLGDPQIDVAELQAAAVKLINEARAGLVRVESHAGYDFNANYMLERFADVANARAAAAAANPLSNIFSSLGLGGGSLNVAALVPLALGGFILYEAA